MAYTLYFVGGAVFGAALLLLGIKTGGAAQKNMATEPNARQLPSDDDRKREEEKARERQEKEAENLRKQFENMMNYTGEAQD